MDDTNRVGQRGPDKQPREFNPKSLSNLKQYQIPENISTKINPNYLLIGGFVLLLGVILWKLYSSKD